MYLFMFFFVRFLLTSVPCVVSLQELLNIIASVLHLGNVQYSQEEGGNACITSDTQIKYLARVRICANHRTLC